MTMLECPTCKLKIDANQGHACASAKRGEETSTWPVKQCWICGAHSDSLVRFEVHHVWERANSSQTLLLCKRCHNDVSHVSVGRSVRDMEQAFSAMREILEDRDWRVRAFFLKLMSLVWKDPR